MTITLIKNFIFKVIKYHIGSYYSIEYNEHKLVLKLGEYNDTASFTVKILNNEIINTTCSVKCNKYMENLLEPYQVNVIIHDNQNFVTLIDFMNYVNDIRKIYSL